MRYLTIFEQKAANNLDSEPEDRISSITPVRFVVISLKSNSDGLPVDSVIVTVWWVDWWEFSCQNGLIFVCFVFNKSNARILFSTVHKYLLQIFRHVSYRGLIHPSIRGSRSSCFSTNKFSQSTRHSFLWKLMTESLFPLSLYCIFPDRRHAWEGGHQQISSSTRFVIESNPIFWKMRSIYPQHPPYWPDTLSYDRYPFGYYKSGP